MNGQPHCAPTHDSLLTSIAEQVLAWRTEGAHLSPEETPDALADEIFQPSAGLIEFVPPPSFVDGLTTGWQPLKPTTDLLTMRLWLNGDVFAEFTVIRSGSWVAVHRADYRDVDGDLIHDGGWSAVGDMSACREWLWAHRAVAP